MSLDAAALELESDSERPDYPELPRGSSISQAHSQKLAALFKDEYPKVVHYMVGRTGNWPEARDIAAQAFAKVLEMRDPESVSFLKAYVYRAARNLATDRAKLRAIRSRIHKVSRHEFASIAPSPEPGLMHEQRLEVLQRAIQAMRHTRKMVLTWRMWDELPYTEIETRFAQEGVVVNERTLNRWYADALRELRDAIRTAEELGAGELTADLGVRVKKRVVKRA